MRIGSPRLLLAMQGKSIRRLQEVRELVLRMSDRDFFGLGNRVFSLGQAPWPLGVSKSFQGRAQVSTSPSQSSDISVRDAEDVGVSRAPHHRLNPNVIGREMGEGVDGVLVPRRVWGLRPGGGPDQSVDPPRLLSNRTWPNQRPIALAGSSGDMVSSMSSASTPSHLSKGCRYSSTAVAYDLPRQRSTFSAPLLHCQQTGRGRAFSSATWADWILELQVVRLSPWSRPQVSVCNVIFRMVLIFRMASATAESAVADLVLRNLQKRQQLLLCHVEDELPWRWTTLASAWSKSRALWGLLAPAKASSSCHRSIVAGFGQGLLRARIRWHHPR